MLNAFLANEAAAEAVNEAVWLQHAVHVKLHSL